MDNLKIIGTSHIAKQSVKEIINSIEEFEPGIVAVELDRMRLHNLMNKEVQKVNYKSMFKVGFKGFLFALVASWMSKKLGKIVNMEPGADMKAAIVEASKKKIPIALIDQNIQITLKRISKELTWKEKFRFVGDIFRGIFFKKKQLKEYGLENFDLRKVPESELIEKMILKVKDHYPSFYKVLITERNEVMGRRLIKIMKKEPSMKVLAVVGAGHREGMMGFIKENWNKIEVVNS